MNGKSRYFPTLFKMGTKPLWRSIRLIKLPCFLKRFFFCTLLQIYHWDKSKQTSCNLPLVAVHYFCLTKWFQKLPTAAPSTDRNAIWGYFTLLRLCLALLFFISIQGDWYWIHYCWKWTFWADWAACWNFEKLISF